MTPRSTGVVPKKFKLVNRTWKVVLYSEDKIQKVLDKQFPDQGADAACIMGLCDQRTATIYLNANRHSTEEDLRHTFFHELTHALKYANGESEHDEQEVDRLGGYLHQVMDTSTGEITWDSGQE